MPVSEEIFEKVKALHGIANKLEALQDEIWGIIEQHTEGLSDMEIQDLMGRVEREGGK